MATPEDRAPNVGETADESAVAIMVGNSRTRAMFWPARAGAIRRGTWPTARAPELVPDALAGWLRCVSPGQAPPRAVLAGVAPKPLRQIERSLRHKASGLRVSRFRLDAPCPLRIVPSPPGRVGDDRLAAALGALCLGLHPWIVVDAGSALTINVVRPTPPEDPSDLGVFEGGLIVPGEALALRALHSGTAQLPALTPYPTSSDPPLLGRSTDDAMRAGVRLSAQATVAMVARELAAVFGPTTRLVLTGGGGKALHGVLKKKLPDLRPVFAPDLVLTGLGLSATLAGKVEALLRGAAATAKELSASARQEPPTESHVPALEESGGRPRPPSQMRPSRPPGPRRPSR
jgi:type III pantothenate kinase